VGVQGAQGQREERHQHSNASMGHDGTVRHLYTQTVARSLFKKRLGLGLV
jgi:hypothetical protein